MQVFATDHGDGTATMTVVVADDDHKFEVSSEEGKALVSYEESLGWRGQVFVSEPDARVWKALIQSEEMTEFLDGNSLSSVSRAEQKP